MFEKNSITPNSLPTDLLLHLLLASIPLSLNQRMSPRIERREEYQIVKIQRYAPQKIERDYLIRYARRASKENFQEIKKLFVCLHRF